MPGIATPPTSGPATGRSDLARFRTSSVSRSRVGRSHSGRPRLLRRGAKMSRGNGMRGCGIAGSCRTSATGSAMISCDRRLVVGQPVDEGGVGAVLQKAPHQIGQQILMAADRRIDPAGLVQPFGAGDLAVERLAHAVQPLEFEAAVVARHDRDGRDGVGIVGGELRDRRRRGARACSRAQAR